MKVIQSKFMIKGYKDGNCYFIIKNENENFNVYQLFCHLNKDMTVKNIKRILPSFKFLPDDEIIVSIPDEDFKAFLLLHDVDIREMNVFRLKLEDKQIIV
ncbi:hypothetical protein [Bacillus thuringiensis]|uniref:hypothetical protein n=1 Tax=Bacillus thuringiensis TaxID=1428 RepID=UPI00139286F6|nr:hypothetical protein [Bacillus thuringiensis]MEB8930790.1 hypothetical protein [Bacillus cereus]MCR6790389.1 hypothetical protein [Bacillus thuringiensis]MCR6826301.1 hypothetical protein [Bacillus thuringiensis]MCR6832261.1 hypothetical protein [Bacillus thuringiensis]MEB9328119.1 hypothetical protein [Bacillus cereus]